MQINDCTLCLLPRTCSQESLVELYLLLTKLPIIVEYPEAIGFLLKAKGLLTENSKVLSQLPKQNSNFVPDFGGKLQKNDEILFPVNDFGLAGAVAFCGFLAGGIVRVSFGGLNNTAATEELLLAAYVTGATKQDLDGLVILPQIAVVLQQITGRVIPQHKPVIGGKIFVVESGIHVDGILKNPELYEPFPPETVGQKRRIVLGSHSGRISIKAKLKELNIACDEEQIDMLLQYVKAKGKSLKRHLTDTEFLLAARRKYGKQS